ncbi:MAG: hypothetical protein FIA99_17425 [Ruminiclostridium sp.]|nr:hypothetical protein [Ruminiclostridium sp.]
MNKKTDTWSPMQLCNKYMYFTSWEYISSGKFLYAGEDGKPLSTYGEDGDKGARFTPDGMPKGIRLVAQKAQKHMLPEDSFFGGTIIYSDGKYRSWYTVDQPQKLDTGLAKEIIPQGYNRLLCYAESEDGFVWGKPDLGLYEYNGSRKNNIVIRGDLNRWGYTAEGCVFIDPTAEASERYKTIYLGLVSRQEYEEISMKYPDRVGEAAGDKYIIAICGAVSPDGIIWTHLEEPMLFHYADTINIAYYDERLLKYVAYVRSRQFYDRRSIGRTISDDFRHFTKPETIISTGMDSFPGHVWYANSKTTVPGCNDNHIMFPVKWKMESDSFEVYLFSSSDGWVWSEVPGGQVIDSGLPGTCDGCGVFSGINLVELPGNIWGLPYYGYAVPHKYPRNPPDERHLFNGVRNCKGYAVWPKGRLVALECEEEGEFSTVPVITTWQKIRLNAIIKPTGYIKAAVYGTEKNSKPIRCFEEANPVTGDGISIPVTWKGEDSINHGNEPIIIKFQLKQAKLFGIEFN